MSVDLSRSLSLHLISHSVVLSQHKERAATKLAQRGRLGVGVGGGDHLPPISLALSLQLSCLSRRGGGKARGSVVGPDLAGAAAWVQL